jgi:ATP-binding cassette, subfamily B, bacterial PglK
MRSSLKKLLSLFNRKDKIKFAKLSLLLLFNGLFEMASVGMIPVFLAAVAYPEKVLKRPIVGPMLERTGLTTSSKLLMFGGIAVFAIFLAKNVYMVLSVVLQTRFVINRQHQLRTRLFQSYMYAPYPFYLQRNSAEILRNVNQEACKVSILLASLLDVLRCGFSASCIVVLLVSSSLWVALLSLVVLGSAGGIFIKAVQRRIRQNALIALKQVKETNKCVYQGLEGIKEARILGCESSFVSSFSDSVGRLSDTIRYRQMVNRLPRAFFELIGIITVLASAFCLTFVFKQSIAIALPTIALFAFALNRLKGLMNEMVRQFVTFRDHLVSVNVIYNDLKLLESKNNERAISDNISQKIELTSKIELHNVTFKYEGCEEDVLKDVSLSIPRGRSVAFVGSSGAGKTTIVDVILGLLEPCTGQVAVDGIDIHANLRAWRKDIGYIPQSIYLLDDSVRKNIALGFQDEAIDDISLKRTVRAAQLDQLVDKLPEGLDTIIGEHGVRLSGGQRQRIGIARALYHNPDVLIMDEATAALDNTTERAVIQSVNALKGDRTIIMIAHRLTTVKDCDCIYFMRDGQIVSSGTYAELHGNHPEFQAMVGQEH